jgi:hypothetical protein
LGDFLLWADFFNTGAAQIFVATFFHGKSDESILSKNRFGYILRDFFTNSSGHPEH